MESNKLKGKTFEIVSEKEPKAVFCTVLNDNGEVEQIACGSTRDIINLAVNAVAGILFEIKIPKEISRQSICEAFKFCLQKAIDRELEKEKSDANNPLDELKEILDKLKKTLDI